MGCDGISVTMIILTALVSLIAVGSSWSITKQIRGYFVMFLLLAESLRSCEVADALPGSTFWAFFCHHQSHVPWVGASLHDLIQPSFSFLVGVSLPYSLAARAAKGQSRLRMTLHAFWRAFVLVYLGVVLRSLWDRPIPDYYWFVVPKSEFAIVDDWHTIGLRGTGSKTAVLENAFVPAHRALDFALLREASGPGLGLHEEAIFKIPLRAVLASSLVGISLGVARAALEWWEAWQAKRTGPGFRAMKDMTGTQIALGEAAARLDAAATIASHTSSEIMREAEAGIVADFERRSLHNLRVAYVNAIHDGQQLNAILLSLGRGVGEWLR